MSADEPALAMPASGPAAMDAAAGYDYVVVGGGSAGCVVAARLSEDPAARVLLLEAGSTARTRAMTVPNAWPENVGSAADWSDITTSQASAGPLSIPRGRALGGSGAINAMAHVRAHRAVYDGWAAAGAVGWDFESLLPYLKRAERAEGRDPGLRGTAGPVRVGPAACPHPVAEAFVAALGEIGCPLTPDLSGLVQEGAAWVDLAIADGERVSSADAYLRPVLSRPNLDVAGGCRVTGLLVRGGRCEGVSYQQDGTPALVRASAEVILCAGAIGSPHLLLLSGIGPAGPLRSLGIEPAIDLPGVGQHLQDHPVVMISYTAAGDVPVSGYNHGEAYAAVRSGLPGAGPGAIPDLHLFPILLPVAPAGCPPPRAGYALNASVIAPDSAGSVALATADPLAAPLIDPGFLRAGRDVDRLVAGLGLLREAAARGALAASRPAETWPGPDVTGEAGLRDYIRHRVGSYYHPVGTCRMGTDDVAVVDPALRVRGVSGLRVADASVMPEITNAHPNATVLAIAERAAELMTAGR